MNIFTLDNDPVLAAQMQCDAHVVKMILESAQLLSSVLHTTETKHKDKIYKLTHKNHPCSIWARESLSNYRWLCKHADALIDEHIYRYSPKTIHKSSTVIDICKSTTPNIPDLGITKFVQAMPDEYKHDDSIIAYRKYYKFKEKTLPRFTYTKRVKPEFLIAD